MKEYKKYKDIPIKYCFDLDFLLGGSTIEELISDYFAILDQDLLMKDTKYNDDISYLNYLNGIEKKTILENKIFNYLSNNISINVVDPHFNKIQENLELKLHEYSIKMGSEINRFFANEENLKKWIKQDSYKNYRKDILFLLESKKHKLSNTIEEFIKKISKADISASNIFSILYNSELNYGYAVSSRGKKIKITTQNRIDLLKSKDENIRKTTYQNWNKAFLNHKNTFSNLLYQHFKNISVWAKERKYNSSINYLIFDDKVDEEIINSLFKNVQKHNNLFEKYFKNKKIFFKMSFNKQYKPWDSYLNLIKTKEKYTIEETNDLVSSSLKPLGKEYNEVIFKMLNERWIDYLPVKNKRGGAYSIGGSFGLEKKYILMNFDGSLRSVATLAHEAGHSLHSYFSDKYQPYNLSAYPIFLAEIASIFNELMLQDYLVNNLKDEKLIFNLISESISNFIGTVRTQTIWSNYEYDLYNLIDQNNSFSTFESLKDIYKKNGDKYNLFKNNKKLSDDLFLGAFFVPHYYYDFYMYKYAIGFIVANTFFERYKKNGIKELENYINNFLKAGNSDFPIELLKEAGIDLRDSEIYDQAFENLKNNINLYIKLGTKIFKNKK
ncbi:MAG: oligoendopeptidase F [Metamycoplasmataceae bacterium]